MIVFLLWILLSVIPSSVFSQDEYYDDYYDYEYVSEEIPADDENAEEYYYYYPDESQIVTFTNQIITSNEIYITNHSYVLIPSIETIYPNICLAVLKNNIADVGRFLSQDPNLIHAIRGDGNSLLHIAALQTNSRMAQLLVNKGADINRTNRVGRTPLHIAAQQNNVGVAGVLINANANVRVADRFGHTPLWIANIKGFPMLIQLLADNQQKQQITNTNFIFTPSKPLKKKSALNPPSLFDLHHNFTYKVAQKGPISNTPWHVALASYGFIEAQKLVEMGMDPNQKSKEGITPLHLAALYSNAPALEFLLSLNNIKMDTVDKLGNSVLHLAAEKSTPEIIKILIETGFNVIQTNKNGATPLYQAVFFKNIPVIQYLLAQGISPNTKTIQSRTPLHEAAKFGYQTIVRDLLAAGADYNIVDYQGYTPLFLAAESGHINVIAQLKEQGDTADILNKNEQTPLHVAMLNNHSHIVRYLVDEMQIDIGVIDVFGQTVLDIAYLKGSSDIINYLTSKFFQQQTGIVENVESSIDISNPNSPESVDLSAESNTTTNTEPEIIENTVTTEMENNEEEYEEYEEYEVYVDSYDE